MKYNKNNILLYILTKFVIIIKFFEILVLTLLLV